MSDTYSIGKRAGVEALGTFWLVLGGCGSAIYAATFPGTGIGFLGVSLAFGLTIVTYVSAVGHISGGHLNPAVTIGLWAARRIPGRDVAPYVVAQVLGSIAAAVLLYAIARGAPSFSLESGFAANGYGAHSPGGYSLGSALMAEGALTAMFLVVILGATRAGAPAGMAPFAIGLCLALIHLVSIPITNTSVNPARSTGPALVVQGWALAQLWLFWVAPIAGAAIAGVLYGFVEHGVRAPQRAGVVGAQGA